MRIIIFLTATLLLAVSGATATVEAASHTPWNATVLQGQDGGTATGGPVGGLPDRN